MKKHTRTNEHHEKVTHHAKSLIAATAHIADTKIEEARNRLSEVIEVAKEGMDYVEERVVEGANQADEFVRKKPYQAVGIGIGIGLILGIYLTRRK